MKLEVHERIALLDLLPKQSDYIGLLALRKAREIISFTPEESEYYELRIGDDKRWHWDGPKASQRILDAPIEEYIVGLIREKLAELNDKKLLSELYLSLYEKFITNYQAVE